LTNRPNGVLDMGVTSDIGRRAYEHREGLVPGFAKRYLEKAGLHGILQGNRRRDPARVEHQALARAWKARLILAADSGFIELLNRCVLWKYSVEPRGWPGQARP
jgi:putative endonuclease